MKPAYDTTIMTAPTPVTAVAAPYAVPAKVGTIQNTAPPQEERPVGSVVS